MTENYIDTSLFTAQEQEALSHATEILKAKNVC